MIKKLWWTFGPFLLALGLLGVLFLFPWRGSFKDQAFIQQAATSLAPEVMKGEMIKNEALKGNYLPIMGSSELARFSPFHPAALTKKYPRGYQPLLLGSAGSQSFTHFLSLSQMDIPKKKAVFIISPQWFTKNGVGDASFSFYYSPMQTYDWLLSLKKVTPTDLYIAKRLLSFSAVKEDPTLMNCLKALEKNQLPTGFTRDFLGLKRNFYKREEEMFSFFHLKASYLQRIQRDESYLPPHYNFQALDKEAFQQGRRNTQSNPYEISDYFYRTRIKPSEKNLKGAQRNYNYCYSKEFSDFQLVLEELAKKKVDCLFVITPVNKRWSDYTGLSQEMLRAFAKKITYQLKSQGFTHVLDLNPYSHEDYFMEDTIHIGWRGWLKTEAEIHDFQEKKQPVHYHLSAKFLTKAWDNLDPKNIPS